MCGRFALLKSDGDLLATDSASRSMLSPPTGPRSNIARLQSHFVITTDGSLPWHARPCGTGWRLSGTVCWTFRDFLLTADYSRPTVRIHLAPPTSLSLNGHFGELREIRACARDLPSHADPERDVVGTNRPKFANPLCARFPYVRPHAIGGMPIRGSERSGAGLSLFFRPQRVPNPLPIWPRQSNVC
jgi:hypothetical protein